ncbi:MAG TPA: FAD:protein FMN transferase [Blastocatellia bacterium]|jgi:thiamine biosynthesis lipoprotein|nr:FAD:protein FMN transferase [Blastocatellia bacterium]
MLKRRAFLNFSPIRPAPPSGYWQHVSRTAMACRFEVTLPLEDQAGVSAARQALDEVDRLEEQLTVFRESSEVSLINREAAAGPVHVEQSLFSLLLLCRELCRETGGAFDVTSGPLSRCWGFLRRQGRIPEFKEIEEAKALVGADKLLFDYESRSLRFARPGVEINLGSVGKGYALDRIAVMMRKRARSALLSAGSSSLLAIGGADGHNSWTVGVRHPLDKERRLAVARLRDAALSTSGGEEQFFEYGGKRYGHIIDPRTGWPADQVASVTVIAQSAAVTDALATAFYVGGPELAADYCDAHPGVLVLMLESDAEHPVIFGANDQCNVEIING